MSKAKGYFRSHCRFFFPLLFRGNVRLRHLWPRASKATPASRTVLLSCLFETNSK